MYCRLVRTCVLLSFFFFNDTATTEIYTYVHTLSRPDALPIWLSAFGISGAFAADYTLRIQTHYGPEQTSGKLAQQFVDDVETMSGGRLDIEMFFSSSVVKSVETFDAAASGRSEEHTSELQSLMRISYAVFCLKKKITTKSTSRQKVSTNLTL